MRFSLGLLNESKLCLVSKSKGLVKSYFYNFKITFALNAMMNKITLFIFFVLLSVIASGQSKKFTITWGDKVNVSTSEKPNLLPGFQAENYSFSSKDGIKFNAQWQESNVLTTSATLQNVQYAPLNDSEIAGSELLAQSQHNFLMSKSVARGKEFVSISFSPIIRRNGVLQKVTSFTVSYNKGRAQNATRSLAVTNSVLSSGDFYKFKVEETGVYKIEASFLADLGMNLRNINPANLKIYGDGGRMLPLRNRDNAFYDPPENAIKVVDGEDGSFDNVDYILFYAKGSKQFHAESLTHVNAYDDNTYYYITASGGAGRRIQAMQQPVTGADVVVNTFNDYQFHEVDNTNLLRLGRRWFGEEFGFENEQTFNFSFPNRVASSPVDVRFYVAAISESDSNFSLSLNGSTPVSLTVQEITDSRLARDNAYDTFRFNDQGLLCSGDDIEALIQFDNLGNPSAQGYLDFIALSAERNLQYAGGQLQFHKNDLPQTGVAEYLISNASAVTEVWDVSDFQNITFVENTENAAQLTFKASLGSDKKFVALDGADFFSPQRTNENARVANQNLKGEMFAGLYGAQGPDYIIVSPDFLIPQAQRLAQHNRDYRDLKVAVVSLEDIYAEFSTGRKDIGAIRNFVNYVYTNGSGLKYLCLFGDTSIDYKDRISGNNNIVPTFNTYDSFAQTTSYMSDDYFGALDPDEGVIENASPAGSGGSDKLDLAVGRILADSPQLAQVVVDKIINYDARASYGRWHNNFVLVSDDVDQSWEFTRLESTLDALGDEIQQEKPFINVIKIHSDSYEQQASAGGERYPQVNDAISDALEAGALVMNYLGHGGEDNLASEVIFTRENAKNLKNGERLPVIVTVTCEFTRFDNPTHPAAGEDLFWNAEGGAVGLVATTREIFVQLGVTFNQDLAANLFSYGTNEIKSVAENLRETKNGISDELRRVIFYIGDPAMELAFAEPNIRLTAINDVPLTQAVDTLKALGRVKMSGEVVTPSGQLINDYNGKLSATVFDKFLDRQTLGNDGVRDSNGNLLILDFKELGNVLYNGQASVENGLFDFEFVVPRDAQIPVGKGRVSFYAERENILEDKGGYNMDILVGGLNENAPEDNEGPLIQLYMNDESFVNGGITNSSPFLLAKLEDENGINTAGGIGHDLIAILDGDEENPIILNDFYESDEDNFTLGQILRKLRDLEPGLHTITVRAWDTYNNSSTADIQFVVVGDEDMKLEHVINYPNPFVNYTEFWFNHNRPFEPLEVQVQIFTVSGKVVKTINQTITSSGFLSRDITWDGRDDFGQKIGKGVYVYKITVKSTLTNKQVEKIEKLVIL